MKKIVLRLSILALYIQLTSCHVFLPLSISDLPESDGNYILHGNHSSYPPVKNASISNNVLSGKFDFSENTPSGSGKIQIFVSHDSLIKTDNDKMSLPVSSISKIYAGNDHYRNNRKKYDHLGYSPQTGDPYNPRSAGTASFLIPGLGQMISGEVGRGTIILGSYWGCLGMGVGGSIALLNEVNKPEAQGSGKKAGNDLLILVAGFIGAIVIDLWQVGDAVRVAEVNNLAFRDLKKPAKLIIVPYINTTYYQNYRSVPLGVSCRISF
jgi:hypothetical protein